MVRSFGLTVDLLFSVPSFLFFFDSSFKFIFLGNCCVVTCQWREVPNKTLIMEEISQRKNHQNITSKQTHSSSILANKKFTSSAPLTKDTHSCPSLGSDGSNSQNDKSWGNLIDQILNTSS